MYDVLVLGPGGAKGFYELGALWFLEKNGYLKDVKNYIGVSIGSIISLMVVCGYNLKECISLMIEINIIKDFSDINIKNIKDNKGFISNKYIKINLEKLIIKKIGFIPSLKELFDRTGINFISVAFNKTLKKEEHLSHKTFPHLSCIEACLLSSNIPFLFYEIKHNNNYYLDGALCNPYPINILDDGKNKILGIHLESDENNYILNIINVPLYILKEQNITKCSELCDNIKIITKINDTTGMSISIEDKAIMVLHGYNTCENYFKSKRK